MPDCVGLRSPGTLLRQHEGFGRASLAGLDLCDRSPGGYGAILGQQLIMVTLAGVLVTMFDEQPVRSLSSAPIAVIFHPHENPATAQALALQGKFELARFQGLLGRLVASRNPVAAVPELHRAAAVFAFGNRAFEITVIERMIFDLNGEPLVGGIQGGASGHSP